MGSAGASSKPIQEPPKIDFQPPAMGIDESKSKKEQLPNPGTMEEINKRTKGKPIYL